MNKTLLTLQQRFFCPRMAGLCEILYDRLSCMSTFSNMGKDSQDPFSKGKYDLNESTMTNISMDIKYMPNSENGYNYILVMLCEN